MPSSVPVGGQVEGVFANEGQEKRDLENARDGVKKTGHHDGIIADLCVCTRVHGAMEIVDKY